MRDVGWMSGWEFTLIQALDTGERWCPERTKRPYFFKCVLGGPLLQNPLGKLLKCKFLGSIQMFCIRISTEGPGDMHL